VNYLNEPRMAGNTDFYSTKFVDQVGLAETDFHRMISLERRRTVRSNKSFLLMLLDMGRNSIAADNRSCLRRIMKSMPKITRETDVTGWYKQNSVVGVVFTEIKFDDQNSIPSTLLSRLHEMLRVKLSTQDLLQMNIEFHVLPEAKGEASAVRQSFSPLYAAVSVPSVVTESSL
jgi:hypothetical protein